MQIILHGIYLATKRAKRSEAWQASLSKQRKKRKRKLQQKESQRAKKTRKKGKMKSGMPWWKGKITVVTDNLYAKPASESDEVKASYWEH